MRPAKAFRITWEGRETRSSRALAKLLLDPDPSYKPTSRLRPKPSNTYTAFVGWKVSSPNGALDNRNTSDIPYRGGSSGGISRRTHRLEHSDSGARPRAANDSLKMWEAVGFILGFASTNLKRHQSLPTCGPAVESIEISRGELKQSDGRNPGQ